MRIVTEANQYIDSLSESDYSLRKLYTIDRVLLDFQKKRGMPLTVQEKHCLGLFFYIRLFIPRDSEILQFYFYALQEDADRKEVERRLHEIGSNLVREETFHRMDFQAFLFLCKIVRRIFPGIGGQSLVNNFSFLNDDLMEKYQKSRKTRAVNKYRLKTGMKTQLLGKGSYGEVFRRQGVIDKIYFPSGEREDGLQNAILWDRIITQEIDRTRQYMRSPVIQIDRSQNRISFRNDGISLFDLLISKEIDDETAEKLLKGWISIMYSLLLLHRAGYAHRDIKMENVLFDPKSGKLGLIDFDLMMNFDDLNSHIYQPVYYVWPLETYYYRARGLLLDKKHKKTVFICSDENGFISRMQESKYCKLWTLFGTDPRLAFEILLERIQRQGDKVQVDPSSFPKDSYSEIYFKVYASKENRELIRYDPSKVDTFSVGILMMFVFYHHESMSNYLQRTYDDSIIRDLHFMIFRMTHPLPKERYHGEKAYEVWIEWMKRASRSIPETNKRKKTI
uniref:Protein kinase domain-containing protein n=1 Tax=viral metagenome TaxID=1070528 RepID=A0A6C0K5J9_9ZZZZ